jgi:predicted O-methyltransferase YrrM
MARVQATTSRRGKRARNWTNVIGKSPDAFSDAYVDARPEWIGEGSLSHYDARFLFRLAMEAEAPVAVEIGTASGFSTGLLCHALAFASKAKRIDSNYRVVTYDIDAQFYADRERRSGDAAREQLPPALLKHVTFRAPATVADLDRDFGVNEIRFLFVDGSHRHPWPTLDLLGALDYLAPAATVVLHDINLPLIHPKFADWGVKNLFDSLVVEKEVTDAGGDRNIGSIRIPPAKEELREQLLRILYTHAWELDVSPELTTAVLT